MTISDDMLMAYADGELDAATAAQIETAMASDPLLVRRVRELRTQRQRLQAAFAGVLREPVPPRLIAAAQAVQSIRRGRSWGWREFAAIAASLVVGVVAAWLGLRPAAEPTMISTNGALVAQGELAQALSDRLAGEAGAGAPLVGLSFRDKSGAYCRTFVTGEHAGMAGLACRTAGNWRITLVTDATPGAGSAAYRMAAGELSPELLRAVEGRIAGEPLDAEGEKSARARGWVD